MSEFVFKMTREQKKMIAFLPKAERRVMISAMKDAAEAYEKGRLVHQDPALMDKLIQERKARAKMRRGNKRKNQ